MSDEAFLNNEINDMTKRIMSHLNSERGHSHYWGDIFFHYQKNGLIVISKPGLGEFVFMSAKGAAEFVLLNAIRHTSAS